MHSLQPGAPLRQRICGFHSVRSTPVGKSKRPTKIRTCATEAKECEGRPTLRKPTIVKENLKFRRTGERANGRYDECASLVSTKPLYTAAACFASASVARDVRRCIDPLNVRD